MAGARPSGGEDHRPDSRAPQVDPHAAWSQPPTPPGKRPPRSPFGAGPFLPTLARVLEQLSGERIPVDAFQLDRLPAHLVMKIRLVDEQGKTLAVDASLDRLRGEFAAPPAGTAGQLDDAAWNRPVTRDWDFGNLPSEITITRGGLRVPAYPAVLDHGDGVVVRLLDTADRARQESRAGLRRLYYLAQRKSLQAHVAWLPRLREIKLFAGSLPGRLPLENQLALLLADRAFLGDRDLPRTPAEYQQRLADAAEQRRTGRPRPHGAHLSVVRGLSRRPARARDIAGQSLAAGCSGRATPDRCTGSGRFPHHNALDMAAALPALLPRDCLSVG